MMAFINCAVFTGRKTFVSGDVCANSQARKLHTVSRRTFLQPFTVSPHYERLATKMELAVGSSLPKFSLPASGGGTISSDDIKTGTTIVYFYPRDATPGCTTEAQDFRDLMPKLKDKGVGVIGVSKDSVESHDKFVKDQQLPFPLISDDGTLCEAFGVWKVKQVFGVEKEGIERSTFIVKDGQVAKEWRGVKSGGHAQNVFDALDDI